jgi:hypothetical protein
MGKLLKVKHIIKTLKKDFELLQSGEWQPDSSSCEASIDNCEEALSLLEDAENLTKEVKHRLKSI